MKLSNQYQRSYFAVLLALAALASVACTEKKPLKSVLDPAAYMEKGALQDKQFYYIRGIEEADSNNDVDAFVGSTENFGIVRARITERELQLQLVFDPQGREVTAKTIDSFAIVDQFDIEREKTDFGEQTNRIVESRHKPWQERRFIRVDWSRGTSSFGSVAEQVGGPVKREENFTLLEAPKNENGHISWLAYANFYGPRSNQFTAPFSQQRVAGSRVTYRTHLMPVIDSNFKPVDYTLKDFSRFGYFTLQLNFEDPEKGLLDSTIRTYARVFDVCEAGPRECAKKQIKWVLSENFPKDYIEATQRAIGEWNKAFQGALNRRDNVVVLDLKSRAKAWDPRQNVISWYDAKTPWVGMLGLAQAVADPRTGQVLSANATLYESGIRGILGNVDVMIDALTSDGDDGDDDGSDAIRSSFSAAQRLEAQFRLPFEGWKMVEYQQASRRKHSESNSSNVANSAEVLSPHARRTQTFDPLQSTLRAYGEEGYLTESPEMAVARRKQIIAKAPQLFASQHLGRLGERLRMLDENASVGSKPDKFSSIDGVEPLLLSNELLREEKRRLVEEAMAGLHAVDLVEGSVVKYVLRLVAKKTPQQLLSEREAIKAKVAQLVFESTLLHELGHAFGLRHNLMASADKRHYHPDYASSSVMDYADFQHESPRLGPYDRAALKYVYNRSIDRETDEVTKAGYYFCADHEVGENLLCHKGDSGANVTEVTLNRIRDYEREWALRHHRRGRIGFDLSHVLSDKFLRTMIPIRQVIDEYVYLVVTAEPNVDRRSISATCSKKYVQDSIAANEIVNICQPLQAESESLGVIPGDESTYFNGLIDSQTGKRRKGIHELNPNGFADLVSANYFAQQFFKNVLGSAEPGKYVALKTKAKGFQLAELPPAATEDDALWSLAQARVDRHPHKVIPEKFVPGPRREKDLDEKEAAALVHAAEVRKENEKNKTAYYNEMKPALVELHEGVTAKPFKDHIVTEGGQQRLERIGSFWDKQTAILALGLRDLGVRKYAEKGLTGNIYLYPHTRQMATRLFSRLMAMNPEIQAAPVLFRNGQVVTAGLLAKLDLDLQSIATAVGFADFVARGDKSFLAKTRICSAQDTHCPAGAEHSQKEFVSVTVADVYRAHQTLSGDSIAFDLISEAKEIAAERDKHIKLVKRPHDHRTDLILKMDELESVRLALNEKLGLIESLEDLRDWLTAPEETTSVWKRLIKFSHEFANKPKYTFLLEIDEVSAMIVRARQRIDAAWAEIKSQGICIDSGGSPTGVCDDEMAEQFALIKAAKVDFATFEKGALEVLGHLRELNLASEKLEKSTQDLAGKETAISVIREVMKVMGN